MDCEAAREFMSRYLDDELSSDDKASLEGHVEQCSACRDELSAQQRLWAALLRVEPIRPPEVIAAVQARLSKRRGWQLLLVGPRVRALGYTAAAAVLVGLFTGIGIWAGAAHHRSTVGEHDRAVADLLTDAPPGMEVVTLLDEIGERR